MENYSVDRYRQLCAQVAQAASTAGRGPGAVRLMGVTKTVPAEKVNAYIDAGLDLIGENRVQEFLDKYPTYHKQGLEIHFIGQLQRNKVKYIVDKVHMIESVDSLELAREISKRCAAIGKKMDVLIEVNIGGEASKGGILPGKLTEFLTEISSFSGLRVAGLMAIPPISEDIAVQKHYFDEMYKLFVDIKDKKIDNVFMETLSMGMSGDFQAAIACGSTQVRLGRTLFGARD